MSIFKKREEEISDLKLENTRRRKEPAKPWGKKERFFIGFLLLSSVGLASFLALSSRNFKLPGLPRLTLPKFSLDSLFSGETIIIGKKVDLDETRRQAKAEAITEDFKEKTRVLSGIYAFYLVDLKSGFSFGVNSAEKMQAASLIKLPVLLTLYREYERGNLDLETTYTLKNADKIAGSGSLYGKPAGTVLTYRNLAKLMGKESDNTAFGILRRILGEEKINQLMNDLGLKTANLETNLTTPEEMGIVFNKLWRKEVVGEKNRDEILSFLTDTIYENWLAAGIPEGVRVAHKYGREIHVINDAGIVFSPHPFVLVLMTQGVVEREADEIIPELAKMIYSEYAGEN